MIFSSSNNVTFFQVCFLTFYGKVIISDLNWVQGLKSFKIQHSKLHKNVAMADLPFILFLILFPLKISYYVSAGTVCRKKSKY